MKRFLLSVLDRLRLRNRKETSYYPTCEKCGSDMIVADTREDGCRYFVCSNCGFSVGEETEEWFKQQELAVIRDSNNIGAKA